MYKKYAITVKEWETTETVIAWLQVQSGLLMIALLSDFSF